MGWLNLSAGGLLKDCGVLAGARSTRFSYASEKLDGGVETMVMVGKWRVSTELRCAPLGHELTGFLGDLRIVGSLEVDVDAFEAAVERVLGRGVDHLVADVGLVGRPGG